MEYTISPNVFFLIEDHSVLLWNTITHEQFLIDEHYFLELLKLEKDNASHDDDRLNELKNAGVIVPCQHEYQKWGWDILSRLFHIGTKDVPCDDFDDDPRNYSKNYVTECNDIAQDTPDFFQEKNTLIIDLPTPALSGLDVSFSSVIKARKTSRSFNGQPVSLKQVSHLLYATFGLIHGEWEASNNSNLKITGLRKSSPSSGGLHAEEAYLIAYNVTGLDPGIYYYRPQDHKLNLVKLGNLENQIINFNKKQFYSKGMAFGIYITVRLDKYWWKYKHSRSYRIMLLDVGHISQTFLLAATALGLDTWITGAFEDSAIEDLLSLDQDTESVILYVGAGHGSGQTIPDVFYQQ